MIITIKIKLPDPMEHNHWECVMEVDGDTNLEDLHYMIQAAVEFDADHMYEFFIAKTQRAQARESFECDDQSIINTSIERFIHAAQGKKMFYLFDYGDSWVFQINKTRKQPFPPVAGVEYPNIVSKSAFNPEQYPEWEEDYDDELEGDDFTWCILFQVTLSLLSEDIIKLRQNYPLIYMDLKNKLNWDNIYIPRNDCKMCVQADIGQKKAEKITSCLSNPF